MYPRKHGATPQTRPQYDFKKTGEVFDDVVVSLQEPKTIEMPTGIRQLDDIIYGLHRGHVGVASARPGGGKTSMAVQMAWNVAKQGKTVFYFSLEMSKMEILTRVICNECEIAHEEFYGNLEPNPTVVEKVKRAQEVFYKTKFAIFDDIGYRFNDAFQVLNDFKDKPDLIVIDHIQLVDKRGHGSPMEAIENYIRQAKEAARTTNTAWLVLSQINRDAEGRRGSPRLEHLKGSGSLEEIADFVLIGSWDGYNGAEYKMDIAKHRHGRRGDFTVNFEPKYYRFKDQIRTHTTQAVIRRTPAPRPSFYERAQEVV